MIAVNSKTKTSDKYEKILEAAVAVFAEHGFYQSTVSQIAKEAGVADGTIYLYFKNKDDILVQFFNYKARQLFELFKKEVEKTQDSITKLKILIHRQLEEFQKDKNMAVVYQMLTRQNSPLIRDKMKEISKTYLDIVFDIIIQGQKENIIRKDLDINLVKHFVLGAVDSIINWWLYSKKRYDLVSMADPLIDLFIKGIGNK